jgi:Zn-dependent peptidase ImmA (M78 family)/transcriptional regulator with XRE-family HTH domain
MAKALISSAMLQWATDRGGLSAEALAEKINVKPDRVMTWLAGDDQPTFKQAQTVAAALHVPFGYLFLSKPPAEELPIPDLRTLGSEPAKQLDINFRDLLRDVFFKRDWFKEFIEEHNDAKLGYVGRFDVSSDAAVVARDIKAVILGAQTARAPVRNWEEYLTHLMRAAESVGIWVMRNGVVGSNTHRPLSVEQFRGFAISDPYVPLIFINGRDAKAAQIFTFAHELAHVWLGESGISNVLMGESDFGVHKKLEKKCNAIAAEFLVPVEELQQEWNSGASFHQNVEDLCRYFRVSRVVVARRAFDVGLCTEAEYRAFYAIETRRWTQERDEGGSGGDFYNTLPVRNGSRFTRSVVNQAMNGRLLIRQAAALLNTQPSALMKLHQKMQAA